MKMQCQSAYLRGWAYAFAVRRVASCSATDPAWVASTADGPIVAAEEQQLKRKLWMAAIKPPMYTVGIAPIVVGTLLLHLAPDAYATTSC